MVAGSTETEPRPFGSGRAIARGRRRAPHPALAGSAGAWTPRRDAASLFQSPEGAIGVGIEMTQSCDILNARPSAAVLAPDECSGFRVERVLEIRRQLGEGTYDIEDLIDALVERILADLG